LNGGMNNHLILPSSSSKDHYCELILSKKKLWTLSQKGNLFKCFAAACGLIWKEANPEYYDAIIDRLKRVVNSSQSTTEVLAPGEKFETSQGFRATLLAAELFCSICSEPCVLTITGFGQKRLMKNSISRTLKEGDSELEDKDFKLIRDELESELGRQLIYCRIRNLSKLVASSKPALHFGIGVTGKLTLGAKGMCCFMSHSVFDDLEAAGSKSFWHGVDGEALPDPTTVVSSLLKKNKLTVYPKAFLPYPMCATLQHFDLSTSAGVVLFLVRSQVYPPFFRHFSGNTLGGGSAKLDAEDPSQCIVTDATGRPVLRVDLYTQKLAIYKKLVGDLARYIAKDGSAIRLENWFNAAEVNDGIESSFIPMEAIKQTIQSFLAKIRGYDKDVVARYVGLVVSTRFVLIERSLEQLRRRRDDSEAFELICEIAQDAAWLGKITTGKNAALTGKIYNSSLAWLAGRALLCPLSPYLLNNVVTLHPRDLKSVTSLLSDATEKKKFGKTIAEIRARDASMRLKERKSKQINRVSIVGVRVFCYQ
jgi:hypothetical protein